MSDEDLYAIVLIPDKSARDRFIEASSALNNTAKSSVVLNDVDAVPHITVAHTTTIPVAAWELLMTDPAHTISAETFSLYLRPWAGATWVGLDVRTSSAIRSFHEATVKACADADITITSETGDLYWPHVTLGHWDEPPGAALPVDVMPFIQFPVVPCMTKMGRHGTVTQIIHHV